jgi:hypothetical protein
MEGENTITERKHFWSKLESRRHKIYCTTGISGICDITELDDMIERLTAEQLKSSGWGKEFSGWQRVLTKEECLKIAEELKWDDRCIPTYNVKVEYIKDWPMEKILQRLTGEQFVQFCKENEVRSLRI